LNIRLSTTLFVINYSLSRPYAGSTKILLA